MKEEDIIQKFKGIDKDKLNKLERHVSFKDGDFEFSEEFKKQVVNDILDELNWNHVYEGFQSNSWRESPSLGNEMGS